MAVSPEFVEFIEDVLAPLKHVTLRRMFGGVGIFYRGIMFGLNIREVTYFKVDEQNRAAYENAGSIPFRYQRGQKTHALKSYMSVPDEVMDDPEEILEWARRAADAALRVDAAKPKKNGKAQRRPDIAI
jgi:DNA transformation protein